MSVKVSVICVYNNERQLEQQLGDSLKTQKIDYELIAIDNRDNRYPSAAKALNAGAARAKADVLVFSHQDIVLKQEDVLAILADKIQRLPVGDIVGTQGTKEPDRTHYANLTSGKTYIPEIREDFEPKLYEVSCVDEGMFGMRRETWQNHPFDEILCDNWHLYGVEMCLYARKHGHKVYTYPSQIHHFSKGKISFGYMDNLKRMCKKYRRDFRYIWTTCYKVRTNPVYIHTLVFAWKTNRYLRKIMRRSK